MLSPLPLLQVLLSADCIFTGICGVKTASSTVPSGLMFVAVGLVALGMFGLRSRPSRR